jgi:peptide deformylase
MLEIIKFPNAVLRTQLIQEFMFDGTDEDPKKLEEDMLETMFASNGIGLAANQVGKTARMFVMGHKKYPTSAQGFFNPIIIANSTEIADLEEGCLSFPNIYVKIKRPREIKAKWQNSSGEWQEGIFAGYDCKCFLHELDHLQGIVFQDRVSVLKWALAIKKSKKRKF